MEDVVDLNKIGVIDNALLNNISSKMIPDVLTQPSIYHYTSINGLKGILENKRLWFTHIDYMNDRDEVIVGAEQLREVGIKNCVEDYADIIEAEAEQIKRQEHKVFVCCFSLKRDELSMWNYYTKDVHNQGFNIGFDYKNLIIGILQNNPELHGCSFSFGKVDYCIGEENYASQTYNQSIKNVSKALELLSSIILEERISEQEDANDEKIEVPVAKYYGNEPIFRQVYSLDCLYLMKRPCFSTEAEFRIVIKVSNDALTLLKQNNKYKYRVSNGLLIPYLDLSFAPSCITGLTLSPTFNSDLAERSIKDYCLYCDVCTEDFSEGIAKSKIPVRF
ncbi:MAG: DUF2971 domain-containing protein [Clostridia bacterium]|nr:DUF2971 domain-containing protein [Clostridia bacterium]